MLDRVELTLLNRRTEIARTQDELERFAARHGFPERKLRDLQVALEEHLTNILHYAYGDDAPHRISVRLEINPPELRVEVADDGRPFNPLEHPSPDVSLPLDQRPIGGLGIHLMRKSLDGLEYRRENGKNILVLIKRV